MSKVSTIKLLDGTSIPWIAYGNGTGGAETNYESVGLLALQAGLLHIDTAQVYGDDKQEAAVGRLLKSAGYPLDSIYLTSKLSQLKGYSVNWKISEIKPRIKESVKALGKTPDLYLIHSPHGAEDGSATPEILQAAWKEFEELKDEGVLKSIGVSNFRPQDLKAVLEKCKYKPVVNQLEFHPYVLKHLEPVLKIQAEHNIVTEGYGPLVPILRNKGGPLDPVLQKIASKLSTETGKKVDQAAVLLLWVKAKGAVAVTTSGNPDRIRGLAALEDLPQLSKEDVDEIDRVGSKVHFRFYEFHMMRDFPAPDLPSK